MSDVKTLLHRCLGGNERNCILIIVEEEGCICTLWVVNQCCSDILCLTIKYNLVIP